MKRLCDGDVKIVRETLTEYFGAQEVVIFF